MIDPTNNPFFRLPLQKPGLISRLLGREPKRNAFNRVNNLLAQAGRPIGVSADDIAREIAPYKVNLIRDYKPDLEDLYGRYLRHCLKDRSFGTNELEDLAHLKALFGLNDDTTSRIHNEIVTEIYSETLSSAMSDGRLQDDERAFLEKLKNDIVLPDELAKRISETVATDRLQSYLNQALQNKRLSPEESEEMDAIARSFGVRINLDDATTDQLMRYRLYWLIESGDPPTIDPGINLQKKEICYFATAADWYEHRMVTTRVRYAGPTARIRIAKGLYFRAGEVAFQPSPARGSVRSTREVCS